MPIESLVVPFFPPPLESTPPDSSGGSRRSISTGGAIGIGVAVGIIGLTVLLGAMVVARHIMIRRRRLLSGSSGNQAALSVEGKFKQITAEVDTNQNLENSTISSCIGDKESVDDQKLQVWTIPCSKESS